MQIDAHQHFWRLARGDYGWLTAREHPTIHRDFQPDDLRAHLAAHDIGRTVLVQAAPTLSETLYLLDLADQTPFVAGVVGWADFEAQDAPAQIAELATRRKLVGLRPMLQDLADHQWLLRPDLGRAFDAMANLNLRFDALVKPRHLPILAQFVARHPRLSVVIDHGAKPTMDPSERVRWADDLRALAASPTVFCKLSGLVNEAGADWDLDRLRPYVSVLIEVFGPKRLMWGSDWPVVNEAGGYAAWWSAAEALTSHLPAEDRAQIFGRTAETFYGLAS